MMLSIKVKRIYDPYETDDGYRILIDRLWPRGITKDKARLDAWRKGIAPSNELRKRFHADQDYSAFRNDYLKELEENPGSKAFLSEISSHLSQQNVTLLTAVKDPEHSNLAVLIEYIRKNTDVS